jgi:hypothetical protein
MVLDDLKVVLRSAWSFNELPNQSYLWNLANWRVLQNVCHVNLQTRLLQSQSLEGPVAKLRAIEP